MVTRLPLRRLAVVVIAVCGILALFGLAVSSSTAFDPVSQSQMAQEFGSKRKLKQKTFKDAPVVVHKVRNIDAGEDEWFGALEIEVKNISKKPIYAITFSVQFPDIMIGGDAAGFAVNYGTRGLGDVKNLASAEDPFIKPGETHVFKIPEARQRGLLGMKRELNLQPEQTANITIQFHTISFGDGTGFVAGGDPIDYRQRSSYLRDFVNPLFRKVGFESAAANAVASTIQIAAATAPDTT